MANSTKSETLEILDRAFAATGFVPTIHDGRAHGYRGDIRRYYWVQQQWIDAKNRDGIAVKRRLRGRTSGCIATTAKDIQASVPTDLWQLVESVKIEGFPKPEPQPEELSPSEKCVRLYWSAWGGIVGGRSK